MKITKKHNSAGSPVIASATKCTAGHPSWTKIDSRGEYGLTKQVVFAPTGYFFNSPCATLISESPFPGAKLYVLHKYVMPSH